MPAELKDEIILVSNYIKDEIKNKPAGHKGAGDTRDAYIAPKELLKETAAMRDTAAIIAKRTGVAAAKVITLLREIEGEEDVAKACAAARASGKDVADIMKTKRTGGWLAVVTTCDLIEKMEEIQETTFAVMTDLEKKLPTSGPATEAEPN